MAARFWPGEDRRVESGCQRKGHCRGLFYYVLPFYLVREASMRHTVAINRNGQFLRIYKKGSSLAGKYLVLYYRKNRKKGNGLGITVTKKIGKAVVRNRIRRLVKENYRLMEESIDMGYDIIFVARMKARYADFYTIQKAMEQLLKQAGLLRKEGRE